MYHTPRGDRTLLGAERQFFTQSLAMIVDSLIPQDPPDDQSYLYLDALMGLTADAR